VFIPPSLLSFSHSIESADAKASYARIDSLVEQSSANLTVDAAYGRANLANTGCDARALYACGFDMGYAFPRQSLSKPGSMK